MISLPLGFKGFFFLGVDIAFCTIYDLSPSFFNNAQTLMSKTSLEPNQISN